MKIRNGFVSNSSSSSFIISTKGIKEYIRDVITTIVDESDKKYYKGLKKSHKSFIRSKKYKDFMAGKIGICLPTCNYMTYIYKHPDGTFWSSSCRNHWWDFDYEVTSHGEDSDKAREIENFVLNKEHMFIDIDKGFIHSVDIYPDDLEGRDMVLESCKKCNEKIYYYYLDEKDNVICPYCGKKLINEKSNI